jgi:hypothetical protein
MSKVAVPLTSTQETDIRRFLGYENYASDDSSLSSYYRLAHLEKLQQRMTHLTLEENAFVTKQLLAINQAYTNWLNSQSNLATLSVAIIKRNPYEMQMRLDLFNTLCRQLAGWIGVPYGGASENADCWIV